MTARCLSCASCQPWELELEWSTPEEQEEEEEQLPSASEDDDTGRSDQKDKHAAFRIFINFLILLKNEPVSLEAAVEVQRAGHSRGVKWVQGCSRMAGRETPRHTAP